MAKPIEVLRDGRLRAAIWKVEARNVFYNVTVTRSFRDKEGNWQDRPNFNHSELPRVIALLKEAKALVEGLEGKNPAEETVPNTEEKESWTAQGQERG